MAGKMDEKTVFLLVETMVAMRVVSMVDLRASMA
jgi:hypothetical protein